jgi:outer membrane protein OmpA-like peptidoglycan-associated protein
MSPKMMLIMASAFLPATVLVSPATAIAQSNPAEKSAEQIRCELNDNCVVAVDPNADGVPTRSWTWGTRTPQRTSTSATTTPQRPRGSGLAYSTAQSARTSSTQRVRQQATTAAKPRTNLAITFSPGTAAFTNDGRTQAEKVYQAINTPELAKKRYLIAGHTDSAGNANLNRELSRRRAQALVDYLVDKGMTRKSFRVRGYGYDHPLDGVSATSPANRRVEIVKLN